MYRAALLLPLAMLAAASAQEKKQPAKETPQVVVALPLAVEMGKTTKLILRGIHLDTVTAIRLGEPHSTGKLLGKGNKTGMPPQMTADKVGDSEIAVEVTLPAEVAGGTVPLVLLGPGGESKPHLLIVKDDTPLVVEKEPNDGFKEAQPVMVPVVIEGSIRQNQDVDVFRFEGKAGEIIHAEVQAGRFGSPLDGVLTLYDAKGRSLISDDDSAGGLDPKLEFKLPRDGVYFLSLIDAHDQGAAMFVYRLTLRKKN